MCCFCSCSASRYFRWEDFKMLATSLICFPSSSTFFPKCGYNHELGQNTLPTHFSICLQARHHLPWDPASWYYLSGVLQDTAILVNYLLDGVHVVVGYLCHPHESALDVLCGIMNSQTPVAAELIQYDTDHEGFIVELLFHLHSYLRTGFPWIVHFDSFLQILAPVQSTSPMHACL